MSQISNPKQDRRSLTHTFGEVGADNGTLSQNSVDTHSPIIEWTCPRKYDTIKYAAGRHYTKFRPRTREDFSAHSGTTVSLSSRIQPVAGEPDVSEQQYPVAVAYDITAGSEIDVVSANYAQNTIELASDPAGNDIAVWPILTEGEIQYRGLSQFGYEVAPLNEWTIPVHVFHDFNQQKNETKIHLVGASQWDEAETLALYLDSPHQIVWQDNDYPRGQYASTIEQRVDVSV